VSTLIVFLRLRLRVGDEGLPACSVRDVTKGVLKASERPCCSDGCSDTAGGLPITIVDVCLRVGDRELMGEEIEGELELSERLCWCGVRGETGEMPAVKVDLRVVDRGLKACSVIEVVLDERKRP